MFKADLNLVLVGFVQLGCVQVRFVQVEPYLELVKQFENV
jgi:hypothetical protein